MATQTFPRIQIPFGWGSKYHISLYGFEIYGPGTYRTEIHKIRIYKHRSRSL